MRSAENRRAAAWKGPTATASGLTKINFIVHVRRLLEEQFEQPLVPKGMVDRLYAVAVHHPGTAADASEKEQLQLWRLCNNLTNTLASAPWMSEQLSSSSPSGASAHVNSVHLPKENNCNDDA